MGLQRRIGQQFDELMAGKHEAHRKVLESYDYDFATVHAVNQTEMKKHNANRMNTYYDDQLVAEGIRPVVNSKSRIVNSEKKKAVDRKFEKLKDTSFDE